MPGLTAQLNDRCQPLDRGDVYEDPLSEMLEARGLGEVAGGGTQLGEKGEIAWCDVEIDITGDVAAAIPLVIARLEELGAPIGSKLYGDGIAGEIPFGKHQGLAVYLNGSDLDPAVYRDCDVNHVYDEFTRLLGDEGAIHSHWQGPTETALYLYGPSFDRMLDRISPFLASYPLCAKARCVQVA